MFETSYLLVPGKGGVIGYITNDIAIRMLFHQYNIIPQWIKEYSRVAVF